MNKQVQEMLSARVGNWEHVHRVGDIFIKMVKKRNTTKNLLIYFKLDALS